MIRSRPGHPSTPVACALLLAAAACSSPREARPNVLWIVWDTVRADHLGLYGHARPTTPFLDRWAAGARVFEDCLSPASYTVPSHASMFTGLLPSEHCAHNGHPRLDDGFTTVAELLRESGYRTYLYSANPHVSEAGNLAQGFERAEHPWSASYVAEATRIVEAKLAEEDRTSELRERLRQAEQGASGLVPWNIKAAGEIAQRAALGWLSTIDRDRPFFVFLNYMEAHRPYIPPRPYRERMMSATEVERSYQVDRSWIPMWEYTFGLREYTAEEIELTRATYDAAIAELDDRLRELLAALGEGGFLDDTVVIVTADHGEHLGEQHMLDHQYSVYQAALRVPLVIHYPKRFAPGREPRPVMSHDLFPTLLELCGVAPPSDLRTSAVSLLAPLPDRIRFAEEPAPASLGLEMVHAVHPEWDPSAWRQRLSALVAGEDKLIRRGEERRELYDLGTDPLEGHDLLAERPADADALAADLDRVERDLDRCTITGPTEVPLTPEQRELLEALGYVGK
jgi:arylsulfatase A-like enzyme